MAPGGAINRKARMPQTIFVLNGPNLNLLGTREPEVYGHDTLDDIAGRLEDQARALGLAIDMRQSNHEGHLNDWLHEANATGAKSTARPSPRSRAASTAAGSPAGWPARSRASRARWAGSWAGSSPNRLPGGTPPRKEPA